MPRLLYITVHAAAGALLVGALQYFALRQSVETSLTWAVCFAVAAAALAWKQTR